MRIKDVVGMFSYSALEECSIRTLEMRKLRVFIAYALIVIERKDMCCIRPRLPGSRKPKKIRRNLKGMAFA